MKKFERLLTGKETREVCQRSLDVVYRLEVLRDCLEFFVKEKVKRFGFEKELLGSLPTFI
jgi:hypothetical protein